MGPSEPITIAVMVRDKQDDGADVLTLLLTHQELLVLMTCLGIACGSERIDATDTNRRVA
jgi:hypothetical protein